MCRFFSNFLFVLFSLCPIVSAQTVHVDLSHLTEDDNDAFHLLVPGARPDYTLKLPRIDTTGAKFMKIFYTWAVGDDPELDVMVIHGKSADRLYVDMNNDQDLSNDGPPFIFPKSQNTFFLDIISSRDSDQKTRISLHRKPKLPDSLLKIWVDKDGNLIKNMARLWGAMIGKPDFMGQKGSFYFDDRVTLRRGILHFDKDSMAIGLYDWNNNGLYGDSEDVVILDLDRNGMLTYANAYEVFSLNDVIRIGKDRYKISDLDKYGQWVDLSKTDRAETLYFLKKREQQQGEMIARTTEKGIFEQKFWGLTFTTLDNKKIAAHSLKGKYLLLNFWGEWCAPCVQEIPDLIKIKNAYPGPRLQILGFLKTSHLKKAKKLITEKKIHWPQILLSKMIEEKFKIKGYPTNILIFPDGNRFVIVNQINKSILEKLFQENSSK